MEGDYLRQARLQDNQNRQTVQREVEEQLHAAAFRVPDYFDSDIFQACTMGRVDVVERILASDSSSVHQTNQTGDTPLTIVATKWQPWAVDIAGRLLNYGADPDSRTRRGYNAIDMVLAREVFNRPLAEFLLFRSKGGINNTDYGENYLVSCNTIEAFEFLVDYGINLNYTTFDMFEGTFLDLLLKIQMFGGGENLEYDIDQAIEYLTAHGAKPFRDL